MTWSPRLHERADVLHTEHARRRHPDARPREPGALADSLAPYAQVNVP